MLSAQEIAERQPRHKRNGNGYMIACPSPTHKGDRNGLNCSIKDGDNGNLLTFCFSHGCDHFDILKGLGIERDRKMNNNRRLIASYVDNDGNIKQVYRTDFSNGDKTFDQVPRGSSKGYKLLTWGDDSGDKVIIITEGEKSAEALQRHLEEKNAHKSGVAASYIGGWNNAKNADYSICKDRRVFVWPDNDDEGLTAGDNAAKEVRIIDVSNLPPKGDAADIDSETAVKMIVDTAKKEYHGSGHGGAREGAGNFSGISEDSERILTNYSSDFKVVLGGATYAYNKRGLLVEFTRKNEDADNIIAERLPGYASGYHLNQVRGSIRAYAQTVEGVQIVPPTEIDTRNTILPTATGGYDISTKKEISAEEMRKYMQTEKGFFFVPPPEDMPDTEVGEIVLKLWNDRIRRLCSRWAAHLLGARPVIDVAVGESGAGKSTAISLLRRAFPEMIESISMQKAMGGQGRLS